MVINMLELVNLRKTFFPNTVNEVKALRSVNLQIEEGSFTAVIGTNGSGKSTLQNAIAGAFPIDAGCILIDGVDISRLPEHRRAAYVGRVFQSPFAGTAAEMSIAENIAMAMRRGKKTSRFAMGVSKNIRSEIADRVATLRMGLENRLESPIGTLSGGQRQALTLLMATWNKPRLLLLDEHTAALDPKSAAKVAQLTMDLVRRDNLTTLMVTHSMQQAIEMPDRIVMMHLGAVVEDYAGTEKKRIRAIDLYDDFDRLARAELFDETVTDTIRLQYN